MSEPWREWFTTCFGCGFLALRWDTFAEVMLFERWSLKAFCDAASPDNPQEEPLRVKIARILGTLRLPEFCADTAHEGDEAAEGRKRCIHCGAWGDWTTGKYDREDCAPPYGEDSPEGWAATGELIGRYKIEVAFTPHKGGPEEWTATAWLPPRDPKEVKRASGATALEAICLLILALSEAGKIAEKD